MRVTVGEVKGHLPGASLEVHLKLPYNHLRKVEVSPTNVVTKRFIGFGGTMMAVPGVYPLWDWLRNTPYVKEILP